MLVAIQQSAIYNKCSGDGSQSYTTNEMFLKNGLITFLSRSEELTFDCSHLDSHYNLYVYMYDFINKETRNSQPSIKKKAVPLCITQKGNLCDIFVCYNDF